MALQRRQRLPSLSARVQARNKALWNEGRSREHADFYTIGYSGRTLREFSEILQQVSVSTLMDIRHSPVSMYKPEFSRSNLEVHLAGKGIQYVHVPQLGVPWDVRGEAVGEEDRRSIWKWYDTFVLGGSIRNLHLFFNLAEHPMAFMCLEVDPTACHRHRLSLALEKRGLRGFDL